MSAAATRPRGLASTVAISFFLSAFAGYLWIGRGKLAVWFLAADWLVSLLVGAVILLGLLPPWQPLGALTSDASLLALLVVGGVSLAVVLPFRKRSLPVRWFTRGWGVALLVGLSMLVSAVTALVIRSFVVQPFSIPAGSMAPNLIVGDYIMASKSAYGWGRYSVPFGLLAVEDRISPKLPERGDIVVFRHPKHRETDYIKRVVGLPGDTVQMIDGRLQLNGQPVELETLGPVEQDGDAQLRRETLPNGVSYRILDRVVGSVGDDTGAFTVPPDSFFMLGDDRDNSADSRFDIGFVPFENLIGRAERIFWNSRGVEYRSRKNLRPALAG